MADTGSKIVTTSTKAPTPDNAGPIIEESQESEEYQQDLQVVLGTAFGVIAVVGIIFLSLLLYKIFRARSGALSHDQDELHMFERDFNIHLIDQKEPRQPTVLMLYAQDCPIHERVVAALANFLMEACNCVVSLDLLEERHIFSQGGLDDWLLDRLHKADYILTVCSLGARLRCSKKHIRFRKNEPSASRSGNAVTSHKRDSSRNKNCGDGNEDLHKFKESLDDGNHGNQKDRPNQQEQDISKDLSSKEELDLELEDAVTHFTETLCSHIPDYFAVAADYVAEKMRAEQQKGLGLAKFVNVYFDYSARSDVPPQLETAAQYCLLRDLKQLRRHLTGTSGPPNVVNEREESRPQRTTSSGEQLLSGGDGSDKSETSDGSQLAGEPADVLDTETGMLLRATLEQAKSYFSDNPAWMEEQLEMSCSSQATGRCEGSHSPSLGFFFRKSYKKRWRRKRHHHHDSHWGENCVQFEVDGLADVSTGRGEGGIRHGLKVTVKEPLLGRGVGEFHNIGSKSCYSVSSVYDASNSVPQHRFEKSRDRKELDVFVGDGYHQVPQCVDDPSDMSDGGDKMMKCTRNTLPRTTHKTLETSCNKEQITKSNLLISDDGLPFGSAFLSRQNSLPSSLASGSTAGMAPAKIGDVEAATTSGMIIKPPATSLLPSSVLLPKWNALNMSKSVDNFAMERTLRQWPPLESDDLPCLYCGVSSSGGDWCGRMTCTAGFKVMRKGVPDPDINPGFSSSTEGVPVLFKQKSRPQTRSQTTILQAEVHQEWGDDLSCHDRLQQPGSTLEEQQLTWCAEVDLGQPGGSGRCIDDTQGQFSSHEDTPYQEKIISLHEEERRNSSYTNSGVSRPHLKSSSTVKNGEEKTLHNNPHIKRWVPGLVDNTSESSAPPLHTYNKQMSGYNNMGIYNHEESSSSSHHHPIQHTNMSVVSSMSFNGDNSASISSSNSSLSDGDSLERDIRSIQKISSFHDFVVSSSFVDSKEMYYGGSRPSLTQQPVLTQLGGQSGDINFLGLKY